MTWPFLEGLVLLTSLFPSGRPNIGDRQAFIRRLNDILDRRQLTNDGPYLREFEQKLASFLGAKHCVVVCNGTQALQIAIRATELQGEVIVPAFTFIATVHALHWQGIRPVFCDVDPTTHTIDAAHVERLITPRTTGTIGVHLWGQPCNVSALTQIAAEHHLTLLFDAAHAFGCSYDGKMIGNWGDAEVFSFHATKLLNTFEGGAVVTNDEEIARRARLMRNFGFTGYDEVRCIGTNAKMSEIGAAMGLTSLESLQGFVEANYENYVCYCQELQGLPGIRILPYHENEKCNYQYVVLEVDSDITEVTRDQLQQILSAENVLARRYFYPGCHRMEPYRTSFPTAAGGLPHTEELAARVLCLPTGNAVGRDSIQTISNIVRFVLRRGDQIKRRLALEEPLSTTDC